MARGVARIEKSLARGVKAGKLSEEERDATRSRIEVGNRLPADPTAPASVIIAAQSQVRRASWARMTRTIRRDARGLSCSRVSMAAASAVLP